LGDVFSSPKRGVDGLAIIGSDGKAERVVHFNQLFLVPTVVGIVAAFILFVFFHPKSPPKPEEVPVDAAP
jgi:hypothetical protein